MDGCEDSGVFENGPKLDGRYVTNVGVKSSYETLAVSKPKENSEDSPQIAILPWIDDTRNSHGHVIRRD